MKNKYSYRERRAYWQGVGFGMATGHSCVEQGDYIKGMHENKTYNSFSKGLNNCDVSTAKLRNIKKRRK